MFYTKLLNRTIYCTSSILVIVMKLTLYNQYNISIKPEVNVMIDGN